MPSSAVMAMVEMPEDHPENAVALLRYVYNERKIGEAYLLLKESVVEAGAEAEGTGSAEDGVTDDTSAEAIPTEPDADQKADKNAKDGQDKGGFPIVPIVIILLLGAAGGGGYYWILNERKKEAEEAARRREKRRQRLMQDGAEAEAEFNRLLEAKRNRQKK